MDNNGIEGLYLSLLELDRAAIKALKVTDPYSIHRVVYSLFDDIRNSAQNTGTNGAGRILFSDEGGDFRARRILILSDRRPHSCVPEGYGWVKTKCVPKGLLDHEFYRFKVTVNPCTRENRTGKIIPVKGRGEVAKWFLRRGLSSWGFEAIESHLEIDAINVLRFNAKNGNPVTISTARIKGILRVNDRELFKEGFQNGIGRAKAFGCGLLQIVPIRYF